ncbi:MAG: metallophosphoesterase [Nanoarchaeota archaeon]
MKILAIGDFHGKFPPKLKKEAEKADIILSVGDYADADKIRKIIFKYWTNKPWYEVVGRKKAMQMEREGFNSGIKILKELNSFDKPVYTIWGNSDFYREDSQSKPPMKMPGFYDDKIKKMKNVILLKDKSRKTKEFIVLGHGGYVDATLYLKDALRKKDYNRYRRLLKRYNKDASKLRKIFQRSSNFKNMVFMMHIPPLGIFDKVTLIKSSPMYGKRIGFEPYIKMIRKYQPKLALCGHMHEHQGKIKIGKTLLISVGEAAHGRAAVIDWPSLKVRFIR